MKLISAFLKFAGVLWILTIVGYIGWTLTDGGFAAQQAGYPSHMRFGGVYDIALVLLPGLFAWWVGRVFDPDA